MATENAFQATSRRGFLRAGGAGMALAALGGCATTAAVPESVERKITRQKFAGLKELPPLMPEATIVKSSLTGRIACKYIDDVIWFLRDISRTRPASAFSHPFLASLKRLHERYGYKVQLNLFYRTDFFYGMDEFTLAQVPDAYKAEFQQNADWLKFGFHSFQEFPDYPWVNADYEDVAKCLKMIRGEVARFAGENMFAKALIPHWVPMSKDGVRALFDGGIKIVFSTAGARYAYGGDPDVLPYGHAFRLLDKRKPETALFTRGHYLSALAASISGYNHITAEQNAAVSRSSSYVLDPATGMGFRGFCTWPMSCINIHSLAQLREKLAVAKDMEFVAYGNHEQYFFKDYFAYQPEYMEKEELCARVLAESGHRFIFMEELAGS